MRSIRSKKIKNEASKYMVGPYDDSLILIQLDKNEKCIQEITKENFERAAEFLRQIKADGDMISSHNPDKCVIKCLSLNTEAYLFEKQKKFEQAVKCLEEAERIEASQNLSPIDKARTKLNKSVIFSHLKKHQESVQLAQEALELLKQRKNIESYELQKNQYKLYEIMIVSFHNIASELIHLSDTDGAHRVYKEGYYLAQKMLGPQHKLTLLLKSIIKSHNKALSKSKEKIEISEIGSNRSLEKLKFVFRENFFAPKSKEQELKRIYAPKRNSFSQVQQQKYLKNDTGYYLRSLEKLNESRRRRVAQSHRFELTYNQRYTGKIRKSQTESSNAERYDEKMDHQKIKDIILNGRPLNKSHVYSSLNRSQGAITEKKSLPKIKVEPHPAPLAATELPRLVVKPKEEESACQLI